MTIHQWWNILLRVVPDKLYYLRRGRHQSFRGSVFKFYLIYELYLYLYLYLILVLFLRVNVQLKSYTIVTFLKSGAIQQYSANIIAENLYSQVDEEGHRYQLLEGINKINKIKTQRL